MASSSFATHFARLDSVSFWTMHKRRFFDTKRQCKQFTKVSYAFWSELRGVRMKAAASIGKLFVLSAWSVHRKLDPHFQLESFIVLMSSCRVRTPGGNISGAENWLRRVVLFGTRLRAAAIRSWSLSKKEDIVGSAHVSWSVDFRSRMLKSRIMTEQ